jgi:hypothetical protein
MANSMSTRLYTDPTNADAVNPMTRRSGQSFLTSSDRSRLQSLVDALPESEVAAATSLLAELGQQEVLDTETAG